MTNPTPDVSRCPEVSDALGFTCIKPVGHDGWHLNDRPRDSWIVGLTDEEKAIYTETMEMSRREGVGEGEPDHD